MPPLIPSDDPVQNLLMVIIRRKRSAHLDRAVKEGIISADQAMQLLELHEREMVEMATAELERIAEEETSL